MGIRYYRKWLEDEGRFQYEERDHAVSDNTMEEITEEEFIVETEKQWAEYIASLPEDNSLRRGIKKKLLDGTIFHQCYGFFKW